MFVDRQKSCLWTGNLDCFARTQQKALGNLNQLIATANTSTWQFFDLSALSVPAVPLFKPPCPHIRLRLAKSRRTEGAALLRGGSFFFNYLDHY